MRRALPPAARQEARRRGRKPSVTPAPPDAGKGGQACSSRALGRGFRLGLGTGGEEGSTGSGDLGSAVLAQECWCCPDFARFCPVFARGLRGAQGRVLC